MIFYRLLQLLAALLLIRLLGRAVARWLRRDAPRRPAVRGGELVRDPVCNTHVPREHALVARVAGREEYFCSAACRDHALATARQAS